MNGFEIALLVMVLVAFSCAAWVLAGSRRERRKRRR